jgi:hypothetical protein
LTSPRGFDLTEVDFRRRGFDLTEVVGLTSPRGVDITEVDFAATEWMAAPKTLGTSSREGGPMPEVVSSSSVRPEGFGHLLAVEYAVMMFERVRAPSRQRLPSAVAPAPRSWPQDALAQSWSDTRPASRECRHNLRPRVAARCHWSRFEALLPNRIFRDADTAARASFAAGIWDVIVRSGTYWLRGLTRAIFPPWPKPS